MLYQRVGRGSKVRVLTLNALGVAMRRREFIAVLGGSAAWSVAARAQQAKSVLRIGFVAGGTRPVVWETGPYFQFEQGMRELGYIDGRDFVIEWRFAAGNYDLLATFANEFSHSRIDIIVTALTPAAAVMRDANPNTPVVMGYSVNPVGLGLAKSLSHPGGNVTGLASALEDIVGKQVDLLQSAVPNLRRVAVLANPSNLVSPTIFKSAFAAAEKSNIEVLSINLRGGDQPDKVFDEISAKRVGAIIVATDATFFGLRQLIAELAIAAKLPSIFGNREYAVAGGLMSYGDSLGEFMRYAASYVDKIARGAKPGDLPIELPTKFNLVINQKTAEAIGLSIPPQLYALANEVIE
jgi:putative tryptophan/tyrosine transport system substrate-binding protein